MEFEMHHWRPLDSRFQLFAAGPNSNLAILSASLVFQRPDIGLKLVASRTLVSLIFQAVGLAQAREFSARGEAVRPWVNS